MRTYAAAAGAAATIWLGSISHVSMQTALTPSALRNHPAIQYQQTPSTDAVANLNERLRRGEVRLTFDSDGTGYLESVLAALDVPEESQLLVFSKTSFQANRITPTNPRALYFNDTVSVGWVRGGDVLEFIAQDARQGAMFYTLDQRESSAPQLSKNLGCVQCHTWEATSNVPGMFLSSGFPGPDGSLLYAPVFSAIIGPPSTCAGADGTSPATTNYRGTWGMRQSRPVPILTRW